MNKTIKKLVENYQCPGCALGSNIKCYENDIDGIGCSKHCAGTTIFPAIGRVFLGMPKGFNRLGNNEDTRIAIFSTYADYGGYNKWNIPTWKHLDENGNTLVRSISPRTNLSWIHVFNENCMDKIECFEVSNEMIEAMD